MKFKRDKRSVSEQAKSGLKIAGAIMVTVLTIALFAKGYKLQAHPDNSREFVVGWALLASLIVFLLATMRFWRIWFPYIPGYLGMRSLFGFYFSWFIPSISGLWAFIFPLLMLGMAFLSFRYSKNSFRMLVADRAALFVALLCLLIAITEFFLLGLVKSVVILSAVGDGVLLLSWLRWKWSHRSKAALPTPSRG
jgi:hypothetical protein